MAGWTALSAVVADESAELYEIAENRLRFREGEHGVIVARFFTSERFAWRKIRLTYRRPGEVKVLHRENFVRARLVRIHRPTATTEPLFGISSEGRPTPSDEIESIISTAHDDNDGINLGSYFFYVEVVMRRWLISPDTIGNSLTLTASEIDTAYEAGVVADADIEADTPSVPIPPPSPSAIQGVQSLIDLTKNDSIYGILTPSPELIGVELL